MNSVPDASQWEFQASESGYTIKKVREDSGMKLAIVNDLELGRPRKARPILQFVGRTGTLRFRRYSLCFATPGVVEDRAGG